MQKRIVTTAEADLFLVEDGDPSKPSILFLHGFPDCHKVWEHQLRDLAAEFHVIAFDMRGCGRSSWPNSKGAYRIDRLLPDVAAVIDATCGVDAKVHLVGHDWGSIIGWSFVGDEQYANRVLSWTSISGPHAGLAFQTLKNQLSSGNLKDLRLAWDQFAHSWYIFALNIPGLGQTLFRFGGVRAWQRALKQGGISAQDPYLNISQTEVERLTLLPIGLYQQNLFNPPPPLAEGAVKTPVQLIVPLQDQFVRAQLFADLGKYCVNLTRVDIAANHWVQRTNPDEITTLIRQFAQRYNPIAVIAAAAEENKSIAKKAVAKKPSERKSVEGKTKPRRSSKQITPSNDLPS